MAIEICQICGKSFKKIASHLKKHKLTKIAYYEIYDREKYLLELQKFILNEYYISYRREFIQMSRYSEIKTIRRRLNDGDINSHISHNIRIGVKFGKQSNLIGFDIDVLDTALLEELYEVLINYNISKSSILLTHSGNKGYHCDIFLSEFLSSKTIKDFYNIVLADLKVDTKTVELRGDSSKGYFLPFGINYKGLNNPHNGYCGIVNQYGLSQPLEVEINKLELLRKVSPSLIEDIISTNQGCVDLTSNEIEYKEEPILTLEDGARELADLGIYNSGIGDIVHQISSMSNIEPGTRHNIAFVYAIALRDRGLNSEEIKLELKKWHSNLESGYSSSEREIEQDIKAIVKSIFKSNDIGYKYNIPKQKYLRYITKKNISKFWELKSSAQRKLYLSMSVHANTYADNEGYFYMTYDQIREMLGITTRNGALLDYAMSLSSHGCIEIVERNQYKKPNKYRMLDFERNPIDSEIHYIKDLSTMAIELQEATTGLFTERELKFKFGGKRATKKEYKKLFPKSA